MATVDAPDKLITLEEYSKLPPSEPPMELVKGRLVQMNAPRPRHGEVCVNISALLQPYARKKKLGRVVSNDSGVVTTRDPDSVRGPDVAYISYQRLPKGPLNPREYFQVAPEVVFEVRSPEDRTSRVLEKVAEYLSAGVLCVCVVDPVFRTIHVYEDSAETPMQKLETGDELHLPQIDTEFSVSVDDIFADE